MSLLRPGVIKQHKPKLISPTLHLFTPKSLNPEVAWGNRKIIQLSTAKPPYPCVQILIVSHFSARAAPPVTGLFLAAGSTVESTVAQLTD